MHSDDCPQVCGVFPVSAGETRMVCFYCEAPFTMGEMFTYVHSEAEDLSDDDWWAMVCLGCGAHCMIESE
jgi:hypothetical protein